MKPIKIAGKEYPFLISAANAKENAKIAAQVKDEEELSIEQMYDQYSKMIHMGLRDGRLTLPFWKRLFTFIPSRKRLERLIEFEEMVSHVSGASTPLQEDKKEGENTEKKP